MWFFFSKFLVMNKTASSAESYELCILRADLQRILDEYMPTKCSLSPLSKVYAIHTFMNTSRRSIHTTKKRKVVDNQYTNTGALLPAHANVNARFFCIEE